MDRRAFAIAAVAGGWLGRSRAQTGHAAHGGEYPGLYERLDRPGRTDRPALADTQALTDSPAPQAASPGRWSRGAAAAAAAQRDGLGGGAGRPHACRRRLRRAARRPRLSPCLRRGGRPLERPPRRCRAAPTMSASPSSTASSTPSAASSSRTAGRMPSASSASRRRPLDAHRAAAAGLRRDRLRRPRRQAACRRRRRRRHLRDQEIGRLASGLRRRGRPLGAARAAADGARPHRHAGVRRARIHVIGGRVDSFHTNSNLHHVYDAGGRPLGAAPRRCRRARSGHGAVLYRGQIFVMGGEGTNRVFGQNEAYDPDADALEALCADDDTAPRPRRRGGRRRDPCRRRRAGDGRRRAERGARGVRARLRA